MEITFPARIHTNYDDSREVPEAVSLPIQLTELEPPINEITRQDTSVQEAEEMKPTKPPSYFRTYLTKFKGDPMKVPPPRLPTIYRDAVIGLFGALICMFIAAAIHTYGVLDTRDDLYMLIPPFGATAVLLFAMPSAPASQVKGCLSVMWDESPGAEISRADEDDDEDMIVMAMMRRECL